MDKAAISKPYLEGLSSQELNEIAENFSLEIPPELERAFLIEAIMEAAESSGLDESEEENEPTPPPSVNKNVFKNNYNKNKISVLLRDPLWAFAFWDIRALDRDNYENTPGFEGYFLHIIGDDDQWTIPVKPRDNELYINLPEKRGPYRVDLCAARMGSEDTLASSEVFTLSPLPPQMGTLSVLPYSDKNIKRNEH
ncbi:MAG: DUF4912 domain-containing protein [Spirochaetaceae bacterium]|jgi:hypothetical protein|nr:DUF4912 domain-containing protein [Spirochaetaceae bacterium]